MNTNNLNRPLATSIFPSASWSTCKTVRQVENANKVDVKERVARALIRLIFLRTEIWGGFCENKLNERWLIKNSFASWRELISLSE
jgi:hypothetical protein